MSAANDGGPAFPRTYSNDGHNGMTLRDWFAGQALAGQLASDTEEWEISSSPEAAAHNCYKLADAMLAARAK